MQRRVVFVSHDVDFRLQTDEGRKPATMIGQRCPQSQASKAIDACQLFKLIQDVPAGVILFDAGSFFIAQEHVRVVGIVVWPRGFLLVIAPSFVCQFLSKSRDTIHRAVHINVYQRRL